MAQCRARTKSGEACRAPATANGRCALHQGKEVARELAAKSIGARRRKAQAAKEAAQIKAPKDAGELVTELTKVFADLKGGELDVATARAMASVATVILKGWEQTAIREELKQLREMINEPNAAREGSLATNVLFKESNNEQSQDDGNRTAKETTAPGVTKGSDF